MASGVKSKIYPAALQIEKMNLLKVPGTTIMFRIAANILSH